MPSFFPSSTSLRVPFCFVPRGQTPPADWLARHPGAVTFPAHFRSRPGDAPPAAPMSPPARPYTSDAEAIFDWPASAPGRGSLGPRTTRHRRPPPHPLAHPAPPVAYSGPQTLIAQARIALSPAGQTALIRSTQAMLEAMAGRASCPRMRA